jgi:hypothetical protein
MDKIHQKDMARSVGLNVADGIVINIKDGLYVIPDVVAYPCYTKPLATMNGGKGGMHLLLPEKAYNKMTKNHRI